MVVRTLYSIIANINIALLFICLTIYTIMTAFSIQPANQPIGLVHVKKGEEDSYLLKINSLSEYPITKSLYQELMDTLQTNAAKFNELGELIADKAACLIEKVSKK